MLTKEKGGGRGRWRELSVEANRSEEESSGKEMSYSRVDGKKAGPGGRNRTIEYKGVQGVADRAISTRWSITTNIINSGDVGGCRGVAAVWGGGGVGLRRSTKS